MSGAVPQGVAGFVRLALSLAFILAVPPLMDGYSRRLKAAMQYRVGPPLLQTWYDLTSLFRMGSNAPTKALSFTLAPCVALASAVLAATLLPYGQLPPITFSWDVFVLIYCLSMVSVSMILAGFSVRNPYANIGANREMMLVLTGEPVLGVVLAVLALNSSSLSTLGITHYLRLRPSLLLILPILLYVAYVESAFIPLDIAEAETEILEGPLVEYGGVLLGLFKYSLMIKRFALLWLASSVLIFPLYGLLGSVGPALASDLLTFAAQFLTYFTLHTLYTVVEASNARWKVRDAMKLNVKVFVAGILILILTATGW